MNENQTDANTSLMSLGSQAGAQKAGEFFVDRALNALVDGVKSAYSGAQVLLGTAFNRYLHNATQRYNQVKTLATGTTPRPIIGQNNFYVSIGVGYDDKRISTDTVDSMLRISNNILILGTGGIGKSMMMRYLFLNTANRGEYVPVLLELRKISNQTSGQVSILDLIYSCLSDFDVKLPKDQFEYSLRLGKYLFLMDGFDEVKEGLAAETSAAIQAFCAKYPKNPCIITSRPRRDTSPLETFTTLEALPLTKQQAVILASKICEENEKTREFCKQLKNELYDKHQDFAENPLLLSMMFLTFMRNNSVPNHLSEFYQKAYDALFSEHDSNDKGYYRREFRCNELDESTFRRVLSHFCFQSYMKEVYEFSKDELLAYLSKSLTKMGVNKINPHDYLEDLRNAVCIIIKDGSVYRFSHRSFQAYFAACYTSTILTDEQQQKLFSNLLSSPEIFWDKEDYYELLSQIEPQRFLVNALENDLKKIFDEVINQPSPAEYFLKLQFTAISIHRNKKDGFGIGFLIRPREGTYYHYNHITLFNKHFPSRNHKLSKNDREFIYQIVERISTSVKSSSHLEVPFDVMDTTDLISQEELSKFYTIIVRSTGEAEAIENVKDWLNSVEETRKKLSTENFIDDL